jgi:hypothetical protein
MLKQAFILLSLLLTGFLQAEQADNHQLMRRLYLDAIGRVPNIQEFLAADKLLKQNDGYAKLVDQLLKAPEFKENLSWQIARHYGPEMTLKNTLGMERARRYIEKKYLNSRSDFRDLVKDILTAKGIEAYNPLVRFYTYEDNSESLTNRFTERVLGMPLGCAKCHDHKFYPELLQKDYWGLSGFFQEAKIKYVKTEQDLKDLKKDTEKAGSTSLGNKVHFNTWRYHEEKKRSIFTDKKTAFIGTLPYPDDYYMMQDDEMMEEEVSKDLNAPQMVIFEPTMTASQIKITQQTDDYKYFKYKASVPLKGQYNKARDFPRQTAALWMTGSNSKFFDRETVNWINNWIMGQGIKMPVTNIYFIEPEQEAQFNVQIGHLKKAKYNLIAFVRSLLLSKKYKRRNQAHKDDGDSSKLRQFKYISGRQLANNFFHTEMQVTTAQLKDSQLFTAQAKIEFKKVKFMLDTFPDALKPQLYSPGNVSQAQQTASAPLWLGAIEKISQEGYRSNKNIEYWLTETFVKIYTRYPTVEELNYLTKQLKRQASFESSNFTEVIWALINSPEMRIY